MIISGLSGLAYHGLGSVGVDSQTAGMVVSGLNVVAGIGMLFTPLAPLGASMIGSGIGAVGFGYAVQALGGSYEIGSIIGGVAGGIAGGYIHRGIQYVKSYRFLRSNGVEPIKAKEIIDAFKGVGKERSKQILLFIAFGEVILANLGIGFLQTIMVHIQRVYYPYHQAIQWHKHQNLL